MSLKCVIFAAGEGKRLNLPYSKVLLEIMGKSIIDRILQKVLALNNLDDIIVVVGFDKERVIEKVKKYRVNIVEQRKQCGTADALNSLSSYLKNYNGYVLVVNGDLPFISEDDLTRFTQVGRNDVNLAVSCIDNPSGFGRIIRDSRGRIIKIAEESELTQFQKTIKEVNVGVYIFKWDVVKSLLKRLKKHENGEYYLTDIVELAYKNKLNIGELSFDGSSVINLNTWEDYARICEMERNIIIKRHLSCGVRIPFTSSVYIENDVEIGSGTIVNPFTVVEKGVVIGKDCVIGPFARIRSNTRLSDGVIIGNFMELKNAVIGSRSKARHLSYLGDTIIGKNVNIGAGTITANYDGKNHNVTIIEDGVTTGSGTVLVAPVKMGRNSQTGAGAVVTKNHNVPPGEVVVGIPARPLKKLKSQLSANNR